MNADELADSIGRELHGIKPGFYPASQIAMQAYLADPCPAPSLSSGCANTLITRSPAHAKAEHPVLGNREPDDSDASDMGTIIHDLTLGGEGKICVIDRADYRSKPTKDKPDGAIPVGWTNNVIREARDLARENGLTPVLAEDMAIARKAARAVHEFVNDPDCEIHGAFDHGESEVTMLLEHEGIWLRARPDWLNHERKYCVHLKTTKTSVQPDSFIRGLVFGGGYDVSLAFYRFVFEKLTGQTDWTHVILAVEQHAPHACSLISLDPAAWAIADDKVQRAIETWKRCMKSGKWPAYTNRICYATPTAWMLADAEARAQG